MWWLLIHVYKPQNGKNNLIKKWVIVAVWHVQTCLGLIIDLTLYRSECLSPYPHSLSTTCYWNMKMRKYCTYNMLSLYNSACENWECASYWCILGFHMHWQKIIEFWPTFYITSVKSLILDPDNSKQMKFLYAAQFYHTLNMHRKH